MRKLGVDGRSVAVRRLGFVLLVAALIAGASSTGLLGSGTRASASTDGVWSLDNGPAALGFEGVETISCPTTTYCVALESSFYQTDGLVWSAGTWSTAPLGEPGGDLQLNSVSCASTTFCMADGSIEGGMGGASGGVIEEWNGTSWTVVPDPSSSASGVDLTGISCPSTTTCYAVGLDGAGSILEQWNGTSWTTAVPQVYEDGYQAVSCSSATSCVVVDGGSDSLVLSGGVWTSEPMPDLGSEAQINGLSCASPTFCVAVGAVGSDFGWGVTLTEIWDGTSWSVAPSPNYPAGNLGPGDAGGGILIAASCTSVDACVSVGYGGGGEIAEGAGYPTLALVDTWDGTSWTLTETPAPVEPLGAGGGSPLRGVSCVPSGGDAFCFAVGEAFDEGSSAALVETTSAAVGSLAGTSTAVVDQSGEVTATVAAGESAGVLRPALASPSVAGVPTGSVTILAGGVPFSGCPPLALGDSGSVSCSTGSTSGPFTASYSGDSAFAGSAGSSTEVAPPTTTTATTTSTTTTVPRATTTTSTTTTTVPRATTTTSTTTTSTTLPSTPNSSVGTPTSVTQPTVPEIADTRTVAVAAMPHLVASSVRLGRLGGRLGVVIELTCKSADCSGVAKLEATGKGGRDVVEAEAPYQLRKGRSAERVLVLTPTGTRQLAHAAKKGRRDELVISVHGGATIARSVLVK